MYQFKKLTSGDITPRTLVLSVLNSVGTRQQTIAELIQAAAVFDIEPPALRTACTRLIREGLLDNPERGVYEVGSRAQPLTRHVRNWQYVTDTLTDWQGDWLVHLTHHLGRRDRKPLRARERAFSLFGYQEAETGMWVRPANLRAELDEHRAALIDLGADADIISLRATNTQTGPDKDWRTLWSVEDLKTCHRDGLAAMQTSLDRLAALTPAQQARETLLVGQSVIRAINLDPLLPDEICDQSDFIAMVNMMKHYNQAGRTAWRRYRESV